MANCKEEKREIIVLATPYVLELEENKIFMHIIEGLKVHQLNIQVPLRKQFMWTQTS
jgi:hypothetical protein